MSDETKTCPFCAEPIRIEAKKCRFCGEFLPVEQTTGPLGDEQARVAQTRQWNPGLAAVLSLVIPGAGQMYSGRVGAGLLWLPGVVVAYVVFVFLGMILHGICVLNAAGQLHLRAPSEETVERWMRRAAAAVLVCLGLTAIIVAVTLGIGGIRALFDQSATASDGRRVWHGSKVFAGESEIGKMGKARSFRTERDDEINVIGKTERGNLRVEITAGTNKGKSGVMLP